MHIWIVCTYLDWPKSHSVKWEIRSTGRDLSSAIQIGCSNSLSCLICPYLVCSPSFINPPLLPLCHPPTATTKALIFVLQCPFLFHISPSARPSQSCALRAGLGPANHPNYHSSALITKQSPDCCLHISPSSAYNVPGQQVDKLEYFWNTFLLPTSRRPSWQYCLLSAPILEEKERKTPTGRFYGWLPYRRLHLYLCNVPSEVGWDIIVRMRNGVDEWWSWAGRWDKQTSQGFPHRWPAMSLNNTHAPLILTSYHSVFCMCCSV